MLMAFKEPCNLHFDPQKAVNKLGLRLNRELDAARVVAAQIIIELKRAPFSPEENTKNCKLMEELAEDYR
jgi:hypothetical protein